MGMNAIAMERNIPETMSFRETLAHDFGVIKRVLQKVGLVIFRGLFWGCVYLAMAIWFVFNAFLWVAMLLTIRDGVQWFLGTNRKE